MPLTPFHFGPGYLLASAVPKRPVWFSFFVFVVSQVVIDCETLYNIVEKNPRLHTTFHTFMGSLGAGIITMLLSWPLYILINKALLEIPSLRSPIVKLKLWTEELPSFTVFSFSALIGCWSHVLLDAINHGDVRPFWPFTERNPFYLWVDSGALYLACMAAGILGVLVMLLRDFRKGKIA